MKYTTRSCKHCQNEFQALTKEVKRGNAKFCSRACGNKFNKATVKTPNCKCAFCAKDIYKTNSQKKNSKSGLFFCNRKCKEEAQKLGGIKAIQPNHYGTRTIILSSDYRPIALASFLHQCRSCGYDRHVEILQVHHKDRDRSNNDISNLELLCPTCHDEEHFLAKDGRFQSLP